MDAIEVEGSEAIEVVAQFDGAIVDVAHIVRDDGAEVRRRNARWLWRAGLGALGVAALAFACAYAGVALGRMGDAVVAVSLCGGTWALLRALDRGRFDGTRAYTIGADPRARCAIAPGALRRGLHALVRVDEAGDYVLDVVDGMVASSATEKDGIAASSATERDGIAASSATKRDGIAALSAQEKERTFVLLSAGCHRIPAGARARVECGGATFHVANVPAPRRQPLAPRIDWTREVHLGGVALAVSAFLFLVYSLPPDAQALSLDVMRHDRYATFVLTPPALPPPPPAPGPSADSAAAGHATKGAAGTLGKTTAKSRAGQLRLPGPVSRDKVLASAQQAAQNAGILGILRAANDGGHIGSFFGRNNPLGDGADQLLLGLHGAQLEDGYGSGFDEIGHGPGGGGDSDKTIGAGPLGTVGFCRGAGCSDHSTSYARSAPAGDLRHRASAPDVVPGQVTVKCGVDASCLDREIVRRIIRQHKNEVRYCYERGLVAHGELAGRVVTQFTIAATGRVLGAYVTESSLHEHDVEQCIAHAVERWEFPQSAQMSTVSYPFVLTPPR